MELGLALRHGLLVVEIEAAIVPVEQWHLRRLYVLPLALKVIAAALLVGQVTLLVSLFGLAFLFLLHLRDDLIDHRQPLLFGHAGQGLEAVLQVYRLDVYHQLVEHGREARDALIVLVLSRHGRECAAEAGLRPDVILLREIDIAELDLADGQVEAVLHALLHALGVGGDGLRGVASAHVDVADSHVDLVEVILVFVALGHASEHTEHLLPTRRRQHFSLTDAGGKLQLVGRVGGGHAAELAVGFVVPTRLGEQLPQQVAHAGALVTVALRVDHLLEGWDGLLRAVALDQKVGIDAVVILPIGGGESVLLEPFEGRLRLVEPAHLGVAAGAADVRRGHYLRLGGVVAGDVGVGGCGLEEVAVVELPLGHQHPAMLQEGVVLLAVLHGHLAGVALPTRLADGLLLNRMLLDGLVTLQDGAVEGSAGRLFLFRQRADGVHKDALGVVLAVAVLHDLQLFVEGCFAVEIGVVARRERVPAACARRVLFGAACHGGQQQGEANDGVISSHVLSFSLWFEVI